MPGACHNHPRREKLSFLIGLGLEREQLTYRDLVEYFGCTRRTASRLMTQIYHMQYELKYISVERWGDNSLGEPTSIKIRIRGSYK